MKNLTLSAILVISAISFTWAQQDYFITDVETERKPWTNLDFYNDPANFQFALVSDNTGGSRQGVFAKGVEKLNMMLPEFVLSVGDLIQGYTQDTVRIREEWEEFNQIIRNLKVPFFYLPGNHDITNLVMQKEWEKRYGRRYYSFTYKGVLFIILDSNDDDHHNLTEDQTNFAIETLEAHPDARWTFVLMHHPIWKYDTGGRFESIEAALKNRKHTVIAGHEHRYQYIERNESNYYVLGTTGGGSRLRGHRFGEFDHIVWVTMTDDGPVMANLRLDGILSHDIANASTAKLAESMLQNTNFRHLVLTNKGAHFTDGTAYLQFSNKAEVPLKINITFHHHHQVNITPPQQEITLAPREDSVLEIEMKAHEKMEFSDLGYLKYYWRLGYKGEEFKDFYLDGNADFSIEPGYPDYFKPQTLQFIESAQITFDHPLSQLKTVIAVNGQQQDLKTGDRPTISSTTSIQAFLQNDKNQTSASVTKKYEKVSYHKALKVKRVVPGLAYAYFEGRWEALPDFDGIKAVKQGVASDFSVTDLAVRKDNFGMRFTGYIEVPEDGMYHFRILADDAGIIKIHENILSRNGVTGAENIEYSAIALKAGLHPVEIDFMEQEGNERLRLYYRRNEADGWIFMELNDFFRTTDRNK